MDFARYLVLLAELLTSINALSIAAKRTTTAIQKMDATFHLGMGIYPADGMGLVNDATPRRSLAFSMRY